MTAYAVALVKINSKEHHDANFLPAALRANAVHGVNALVRSDDYEVLTGQGPGTRVVVLKFLDREHARTWWNSTEMEEARAHGAGHIEMSVILLDGVSSVATANEDAPQQTQTEAQPATQDAAPAETTQTTESAPVPAE